MSVGFAVADIANPIFADIVQGAEHERANDYSLLLTNSEGDVDLDADNIALLEDRQVDGLLLSLTQEDDAAVVRALPHVHAPDGAARPRPARRGTALSSRFDHRAGMVRAASTSLPSATATSPWSSAVRRCPPATVGRRGRADPLAQRRTVPRPRGHARRGGWLPGDDRGDRPRPARPR